MLSQAALAPQAHISGGYLSRLECGEQHPCLSIAKANDEALGADGAVAALAPGDLDPPEQPDWMGAAFMEDHPAGVDA
jgi:predicted transcriptional regulator